MATAPSRVAGHAWLFLCRMAAGWSNRSLNTLTLHISTAASSLSLFLECGYFFTVSRNIYGAVHGDGVDKEGDG
jgi:hypothetical protein